MLKFSKMDVLEKKRERERDSSTIKNANGYWRKVAK